MTPTKHIFKIKMFEAVKTFSTSFIIFPSREHGPVRSFIALWNETFNEPDMLRGIGGYFLNQNIVYKRLNGVNQT